MLRVIASARLDFHKVLEFQQMDHKAQMTLCFSNSTEFHLNNFYDKSLNRQDFVRLTWSLRRLLSNECFVDAFMMKNLLKINTLGVLIHSTTASIGWSPLFKSSGSLSRSLQREGFNTELSENTYAFVLKPFLLNQLFHTFYHPSLKPTSQSDLLSFIDLKFSGKIPPKFEQAQKMFSVGSVSFRLKFLEK